jgi:uncharacterized protein (TIGR00730 family)
LQASDTNIIVSYYIVYNLSMFIITVFGGSQPQHGSPAFQEAQHLGFLLANGGFTVQTGGYIGTMEAISQGAAEAGGHVIGVTCDEIEAWRPIAPNPWVIEELRCKTLRERLFKLIDNCHGAIALPGGIGTLAEIVMMWAQLQVQPNHPKPLILIGSGWEIVINTFITSQKIYIPLSDQNRISIVPDVESAFTALQEYFPQ